MLGIFEETEENHYIILHTAWIPFGEQFIDTLGLSTNAAEVMYEHGQLRSENENVC